MIEEQNSARTQNKSVQAISRPWA